MTAEKQHGNLNQSNVYDFLAFNLPKPFQPTCLTQIYNEWLKIFFWIKHVFVHKLWQMVIITTFLTNMDIFKGIFTKNQVKCQYRLFTYSQTMVRVLLIGSQITCCGHLRRNNNAFGLAKIRYNKHEVTFFSVYNLVQG